jgi:hypothetical protein
MSEEKEDKKEIEVVSGDGSNLDISPVYEHISAAKPKDRDKKPKNIVVPGQKKEEEKEDSNN